MTNKSKKPHPWRSGLTPVISKWAKEQSDITNIQTVLVARSEGFVRKDSRKIQGGLI